jgi:HEAT repeat protein
MPDSPAQGQPIPPYQEPVEPGGLKAVLQLFLVPLAIVVVAAGVFLTMNFLIGDERSVEEVLEQAASGDSRRRGQAAFELALRLRAEPEHLQDPAFRSRLLSVYEASAGQGPELRRYLTQVLAGSDFPEAVDALIEATADPDAQTRLYAAAALGNAKATPAFGCLVELTADDDPGIRSVAVASLASLGDPAGVEAIAARLSDPVLEVSWNAAIALSHLGSERGEAMLLRMLDPVYLATAPGITEAQSAQAMLGAVEALARLELIQSRPSRQAALAEISVAAPYPLVRDAALRALRVED